MFLFLTATLFIFGPSCGGKSTLSKALVQHLGPDWVCLDRDQLIEEGLCTDDRADPMLEEHIHLLRSRNQNIIVDAQRTVRLNRPPKRAHYARLYVESTFSEVFESASRHGFNYHAILDSSQKSVESEIEETLPALAEQVS